MSSKKPASLTSSLIVKKGDASPSPMEKIPSSEKSLPFLQTIERTNKRQGTIAVTVRLDPERYEKLKIYGLYNRLTNQEIIVRALDSFFAEREDRKN